jgi:NAD(P)-dependent dehydrogenase (short-subunit alcohol dehydrogenase family)
MSIQDLFSLKGKVALITGGGRGIGKAIAEAYGEAGAKVMITGRREEFLAPALAELQQRGFDSRSVVSDVSRPDAVERVVQATLDAFGQIDILVNNAGIVRDRTLVKMDESDFDAVIATHLKGTFNCTRHAAPLMREAGYGRIVNITSSAGLRGNFGQTNYAAAKAGIMGMTFVWALELGRSGITVNALAPAGATRMTASLYAGEEAAPPTLDPALNAPIVAYLASERAGHVNGQLLGRTDWAFTLFQHPKQIAWMHQEGGWSPTEVADQFDTMLGQHLQTVGMVMPSGLTQDAART